MEDFETITCCEEVLLSSESTMSGMQVNLKSLYNTITNIRTTGLFKIFNYCLGSIISCP